MGFSNIVALFIIITTAATLHAHGVTDIQTSAQAAEALRPIAGDFAFALFALGIIGTGLLAVPVLAGSAAYALGEALGWHVGLARRSRLRAKAFYGTIVVATLVGCALNFMRPRPDQGAVLERRHQRRGRRAGDGDDHADRPSAATSMGPFVLGPHAEGFRLAGDRGDGGGIYRDVCNDVGCLRRARASCESVLSHDALASRWGRRAKHAGA